MKLACLFNFSASRAGGGLKRLQEFSRWCDAHGGAAFIIHENCRDLVERFPANRYFVTSHSPIGRLFDDVSYLDPILAEAGDLHLYYAYGIPVYRRVARVNWFHLSNVIPFNIGRVPLPAIDYVRQPLLAWLYRRGLQRADVVAAESAASLVCFRSVDPARHFVSVNGSDDELAHAATLRGTDPDNTAVVVGTYKYKAIEDSFSVFEALRAANSALEMIVIGVVEQVPERLRKTPGATFTGVLPRSEVVKYLARASYYISTTKLENSYNAAAEGIFLARESLVSDIPPHRELLGDQPHELITLPDVRTPLFRVHRNNLSTARLKTWDQVVMEILQRADVPTP